LVAGRTDATDGGRGLPRVGALAAVLLGALAESALAAPPPETNYCEMLARDVAGRQHGFLAGNHLYYIGGQCDAQWHVTEHETLGFTHPMFRDGRARGHGIVTGAGGTGHDKWGWEFWRRVRTAYGTVIVGGKRHPSPKPRTMIWRPDRQVCTYQVGGVVIEETKFISVEDVLCAIVTASEPVTIEFDGHSFIHTGFIPTHDGDPPKVRFSRASTASARFDREANTLQVTEGGTIMTKPDWGRPAVEGRLMVDGLSVVLSASEPLAEAHTIERKADGRQAWRFRCPCTPEEPLVLAMAMGDDYGDVAARVKRLLADPRAALGAKTRQVNAWLNRQVPYFRCSDVGVVTTYYHLWSLYFLYFTHTGRGWEQYPHTQTAVNNFMGLHLWDSWAYTAMGAWAADKWAWGHGNVLSWKAMLPFRNTARALPDNFGVAWYSPGVWMNFVGTVEFAWRQYEQSGDRRFLEAVYDDLYQPLYWTGPQRCFGIEINALDTLARMAEALGRPDDVGHWRAMRPGMVEAFKRPWSARWPDYYAGKGTKYKDIWQLASMMCTEMPDAWARAMVRRWVMNAETGFFGPVPLDVRPPDAPENGVFAVSTISTWLAVEGMFRHGCDAEAVTCTLGHLRGMRKDYGYPVAPECWDPDYRPWGSMYYNWDGAMIPLILERLAGVRYSVPDGTFTVRDHLPDAWRYVEVCVPVVLNGETTWTRVRVDRAAASPGRFEKTFTIEDCPLRTLIIHPWLEDRACLESHPVPAGPAARGHADFRFSGPGGGTVSLVLGKRERTFNTLAYLTPHGGPFEDTVTVRVENLLPSTVLRHTTDGTEPTASSPACPGALTFSETTALTLRAFSDNGTVYQPMTATYTKACQRQSGRSVSEGTPGDPDSHSGWHIKWGHVRRTARSAQSPGRHIRARSNR